MQRLIVPLALATIAGHAAAQAFQSEIVIIRGDNIGTLTDPAEVAIMNQVRINNTGSWILRCNVNTLFSNNQNAIIRDGDLVEIVGTPAPGIPGSDYNTFSSIGLNNNGDRTLFASLTDLPNSQNRAYWFNSEPFIQYGDISSSPLLTPGTPYIGLFNAHEVTDSGQIFIISTVNDANIPTTVDRTLTRWDRVSAGNYTETVLIFESAEVGATGRFVADLETNSNQLDANNNGDVIYVARVDGDTASNRFLMVNNTPIIQQTDPLPATPGRNVRLLTGAVSINDSGDWAARLTLDGDPADDVLIVKNGTQIIAREGDDAPGAGGFNFTGFGSGPVHIGNNGAVLYAGVWNAPSQNTGVFVNDNLVLRQGDIFEVSSVIYEVTTIRSVTDGYHLSDNGEWAAIRVVLSDGFNTNLDAIVRINIDLPTACPPDLNGDGVVDADDFFLFLQLFAAGDPRADFNNDGVIDADDFFAFLSAFAAGC